MEFVKKVLCVGKICLDIVVDCNMYPVEDTDQRCCSHTWQLGGNASNSAIVFSLFSIPCEVLAPLSSGLSGQFLQKQFLSHNIYFNHCHFYEEYDNPTSVVLINAQSGSRTIIHSNKDMPELEFADFEALDLKNYCWIHFECRPNTKEIRKMVERVRGWNSDHRGTPIRVSIEMEKPNLDLTELIGLGDYVFVSKDFARACGCGDMEEAVRALSRRLRPGGVVLCAWGEEGASAKSREGPVHVSKAHSPFKVVNTLGAGDTFVAATIMALMRGGDVRDAIRVGCKVAGVKCGINDRSRLVELCAPVFETATNISDGENF